MKTKSYSLFYLMMTLLLFFFGVVLFLEYNATPTPQSIKNKNLFVQTTLLPDLALVNSSSYIRHRSLSTVFSVYSDDGTLREYDITSFTYAPSNIHSNTPLKVFHVDSY